MPETQNIEWKESWRDEYLKWISGFANAHGGKIFIGMNDKGEVVGLKNSKRLMDDLPNKIQTHLGIVCDVNLHTEGDLDFIEIIVNPYDIAISYHGTYHYRSGSTKQELKGNALTEFLLKKSGKTWDEIIESKASLNDIDHNAIEAFKRGAIKSQRLPQVENESDVLQIFNNLKLAEGDKLKRSAVLLFGEDPRKFFIHAYIKIGKFGKTDDELLSQEVIEGNAFELADKTLEILDKKYLIKSISYEGLQRIETTEYPYPAIREVLLNAIVHRKYMGAPINISIYDDKLMVWNYGTLPDEITFEDLKQKHNSFPRNPILADVFFKGGLIESWGRGTLKIINECKLAGLPQPKIEEMNGGIVVTLFKSVIQSDHQQTEKGLNERQNRAIDYVKKNGRITNKEYQELNNVSRRTATRDLKELASSNILISSETVGAGAFYSMK